MTDLTEGLRADLIECRLANTALHASVAELRTQLAKVTRYSVDADRSLNLMALTIDELKKHLAEEQKECDAQARLNGMGSEREASLQSKLVLATEALEVYASESNWHERTHCGGRRFHDGQGIVMGHDHAREALAKLNVAANDMSTKHVDETEKQRHVPRISREDK